MDEYLPEAMRFGAGWILTIGSIFAANLYIAWHWLGLRISRRRLPKTLACLCAHAALALPSFFFFSRFFGGYSFAPYMQPLAYYTGFYLCMFFYVGGLFFFWDLGKGGLAIVRRLRGQGRMRAAHIDGFFPAIYSARVTLVIVLVCVLVSGLAFYIPQHLTVTHAKVTLDRRDCKLDSMRVVLISDTHMGDAIQEPQIDEIVRMANAETPDLIVFAGDIFDEGTPRRLKEYASKSFAGLSAKHGVYYVLGNHDDYRGDTEDVLSYFRAAGIRCLLDEVVLNATAGFYMVGRKDRRSERAPLATLEQYLTEDYPVFLADHRPSISETAKPGSRVQLQLSGHTHDGQIVPAHLLMPWTRSYGLYKRGGLQLFISSGVGEYAVPVRFGSPAEIVSMEVVFE